MDFNYKEPLISRLIYCFRAAKINTVLFFRKNLRRITWIKRYFTKSHWQKNSNGAPQNKAATITNQNEKGARINEDYNPKNLKNRVAVYTCIFGGYDNLHEPLYKSKLCDYYVITDSPVPENSVWKPLKFDKPEGFDGWNASLKNRYCKLLPHLLFKDYRYSIYLDGNIRPMTDLYPFVAALDGKFFGAFSHEGQPCTYAWGDHLVELNLADADLWAKQKEKYQSEGFPQNYGYIKGGVLVREHNRPLCIKVMQTWWQQYTTYVKRDQQGLVYSLWKNGLTLNDITILGQSVDYNPRINTRDGHNKNHSIVK